jgi:hypothetical protein
MLLFHVSRLPNTPHSFRLLYSTISGDTGALFDTLCNSLAGPERFLHVAMKKGVQETASLGFRRNMDDRSVLIVSFKARCWCLLF